MSEVKQYLVRDYMRSDVVTVNPDATLRAVIGQMIENKTNGMVVVDGANRVVGILSSWDVISYLVPDYLEADNSSLANFESGDYLAEQVNRLADKPVSEFMTSNVTTVKKDYTIMEATAILSDHKFRQLPVVDDNGVLVGYLNRTDIKLIIGEILGIARN